MTNHYFSHARTALKYGIKSFDINKCILVPDFICDVVSDTIKETNIVIFYKTFNNFKPDWNYLNKLVSDNNCSSIIMVNYFGIPQDIEKFIDFCEKYKLCLIEDNAHGFGGKYQDKLLGDIGDISISSPRKLLNIYSGGILKINNEKYKLEKIYLDNFPVTKLNKLRKNNKFKFNYMKKFAKNYIFSRPSYEKLNTSESKIKDHNIDSYSKIIIKETRIDTKKRVDKFNIWQSFFKKNNLIPVFEDLQNYELNPWCCPAYVENYKDSSYWFDWGWRNNIFIFSWPNLPDEHLNNSKIIDRRRKLICFSTNF